jgi:cytochrome c oxidase assembly protein subunit 15
MLGDALPPRDALAAPDRYATRLALGFALVLAATFGLIVLGALVRAHEAGLACPDWPLCFGELIPPLNLKVGFEYAHRVVAGSVTLAFAVLAVLALRRPLSRRASRRLLAVAASLLSVQILLGALTVWKLLASWTVTSHLITGNAFAVTLLLTACALRDAALGRRPRAAVPTRLRRALVVVAVLLGLQLALGGLVSSRYAGLSCPEWPTCNGGLWFPSWRGSVGLHLLHRGNGYVLLLALAATAWAGHGLSVLGGLTALAFGLGLAQVAVGIANVLNGIPVELTGLHSALAVALVLCVALALREAWTDRGSPGL